MIPNLSRLAYLLPVAMFSCLAGIAIERALSLEHEPPAAPVCPAEEQLAREKGHVCAAAEHLRLSDEHAASDVEWLLDCPERKKEVSRQSPLLYIGWGTAGAGREILELDQIGRQRALGRQEARKLHDLAQTLDDVASTLTIMQAAIEMKQPAEAW